MPKTGPKRAASEVQVLDPQAHPRLAEASRHIARVLRRERMPVLGLLPCSDAVAVLPAAAQIGAALAEQSGAPVALVDVNARWSALGPRPGRVDPAQALSLSGAELMLTRWLGGDRLALLSLPPSASIGVGLVELGRLLRSSRTMFEHLLIDMTGLERLGEHLSAAAMCDALVLVARAGVTTEDDLRRLSHDFSGRPIIGVILSGAKV